jgi:hypothetical protein
MISDHRRRAAADGSRRQSWLKTAGRCVFAKPFIGTKRSADRRLAIFGSRCGVASVSSSRRASARNHVAEGKRFDDSVRVKRVIEH